MLRSLQLWGSAISNFSNPDFVVDPRNSPNSPRRIKLVAPQLYAKDCLMAISAPALDKSGPVIMDLESIAEIEFRYLELDTPLPTPCIALPPGPGQSPPPAAPSLEKYTSPFLWPKWRKSLMTWISCAVTALAGYSAGEVSPAADELTQKWGISTVVYNLSITIFCIGFALAPMVLAPFSEINGRRPIFVASGILFVGM